MLARIKEFGVARAEVFPATSLGGRRSRPMSRTARRLSHVGVDVGGRHPAAPDAPAAPAPAPAIKFAA